MRVRRAGVKDILCIVTLKLLQQYPHVPYIIHGAGEVMYVSKDELMDLVSEIGPATYSFANVSFCLQKFEIYSHFLLNTLRCSYNFPFITSRHVRLPFTEYHLKQ